LSGQCTAPAGVAGAAALQRIALGLDLRQQLVAHTAALGLLRRFRPLLARAGDLLALGGGVLLGDDRLTLGGVLLRRVGDGAR
jgi:hypothetical protein